MEDIREYELRRIDKPPITGKMNKNRLISLLKVDDKKGICYLLEGFSLGPIAQKDVKTIQVYLLQYPDIFGAEIITMKYGGRGLY